jgi:hypothetical protein
MECMSCLSDLVPCDFCMQMLEEEVEVPVSAANEVPKDATEMDTDDAPSEPASGTDVNMQDPKSAEAAEGATAAENGGQDAEEKSVPMDTDAKVCSALTNFVGVSFFFFMMRLSLLYFVKSLIWKNSLNSALYWYKYKHSCSVHVR